MVQAGVDDERDQLARDDHQLVDRHDPAAAMGGRHLGQEQRHGRRRSADREAEHDSRADHRHERRRGGAADRPEQEHHGAAHQTALAPQPVGDPTTGQRAERGGEQQRAHDEALPEGRQVEVVTHVQQRARDDPGVVPEQQAPERRDQRDPSQEALIRPGAAGWGGDGDGAHQNDAIRERQPCRICGDVKSPAAIFSDMVHPSSGS
jgi:hypothetical protein